MNGADDDPRQPLATLGYAAPPPQPPWQLRFLVVATLVCAGTLAVGIMTHAWRMLMMPVQGPATRPAAAVETGPARLPEVRDSGICDARDASGR